MAEIKIFKDLPIPDPEKDELDFGSYADALVDVILGVLLDDLPFSIGVYGEWGSGKSTLMGFTQSKLSEQKIKTVWFNPWKYDRKEALWNALINEIFFSMEQDAQLSEQCRKLIGHASGLLAASTRGLVRSAAAATGLQPLVEELQSLGDKSSGRDLWTFVQQFEEAFRDVVKAYVGDSERLVIFIDDIDRCLPENAVTVLESLKLFLDKAPCVFVIGADQSVIQYGIGKMYGAQYASRDYLEKIIQIPFHVPRARSQVARRLWEQIKDRPGYHEIVWDYALKVLGTNLRQWKRFLNAYGVATAIANARGVPSADVQAAVRAFVVLLHMRHPDLYDVCNRNPDRATTFFDCCLRQSRVGLKDELIRVNLDDFARFADELGTIDFVKSCWRTISNYKSLSGQGIDATRLQEAFSCVPL